MRQALSVASECAPLVKTGGLADVVGALPGALKPQGWHLRTLVPGYPVVMSAIGKPKKAHKIKDISGKPARLLEVTAKDLDLLVLDAPELFDRPGPIYNDTQGQDWPDNPLRFAALAWAAAEVARGGVGSWKPELVHCHDWQAGFVPVYLDGKVPSILTVHNIAFQGHAPASMLKVLRLPAAGLSQDGFEYWGNISSLKAGLVWATKITTVSPTYAAELCTPAFGMGLDGVIRHRRADLHGILNGIDLNVWNPATDPEVVNYSTPKGKARNKAKLEKEFGLPTGVGPLAVLISRLTHQKGIDVLMDALPGFVDRGGRMAVLGSGDPALEARLKEAASHPHVGVRIGYDEALSHRMVAGGDAILVPSRFEPCGLTQLMGLQYGAIPVVARTGGLADTVIDANDAAMRSGVATGIQFAPVDAAAMWGALERLLALYADRPAFEAVQKRAMKHPVGWEVSARDYARLYEVLAAA